MRRAEASSDVTEVLSEIPDGYHESRREWWSTNSHFWATYVDATPARKQLLHAQADRARDLCRERAVTTVVDCGCGEGMFLRILESKLDGLQLSGLDFCDKMIAEAMNRSKGHAQRIRFAQVDLEAPSEQSAGSFQLAVASLVLDEVENLDRTLHYIAGLVAPGGHLFLTVLDAEAERHKLVTASQFSHSVLGKAAPPPFLLVLKRFRIGTHPSPAPYCRMIRAADAYVKAAERAGLTRVQEETWTSTGASDGTVFRFLLFSKAGGFFD